MAPSGSARLMQSYKNILKGLISEAPFFNEKIEKTREMSFFLPDTSIGRQYFCNFTPETTSDPSR